MVQSHSLTASSPYPRMSYEEYLDDPTIDENTEWVDGEVIPKMSVQRLHSLTTGFLFGLLQFIVGDRGLGEVHADPFNMKLARGRAPDILFVRNEHLDRLTGKNLDGPADLVIEVISEGTEHVDRVDKYGEYERGGVPEYWIVDPERETADFFLLTEDGIYRPVVVGSNGVYESPALDGFQLKVRWLWERPPVSQLLGELGLLG